MDICEQYDDGFFAHYLESAEEFQNEQRKKEIECVAVSADTGSESDK